MRAVVVYESMYGNTHLIAEAIAAGMSVGADVTVVPVDEASHALMADADVVVVGGPTHAHGMSRPSTRKGAIEAARTPGKELPVDPDAEGEDLRDWFDRLGEIDARAAAFDTRFDASPLLTGRASKGIAKRLRHHGCELVCSPESFFVTRDNHLENDEEARARTWGADLAAAMTRSGGSGVPAI